MNVLLQEAKPRLSISAAFDTILNAESTIGATVAPHHSGTSFDRNQDLPSACQVLRR